MRKFVSLGLATAISVVMISLTGCGEGTSNLTTDSSIETQTGYFIDSEVKGLDYKTSSGKIGKTNNLGQFFYKPGDNISFSIGNLQLGEAEPKTDGLITPRHLAQNLANGDLDKESQLEILILRLLQSLDVDSNLDNGITINPRLSASLDNITSSSIIDHTEESLLHISDDLKTELDQNDDGLIDISEDDAITHAEHSLTDWENGIKPESEHEQNADQSVLSNLTDEQRYSLAYMWNEERLAKDIYLAFNDLFPMEQFETIATKSEVKHIDAVEKLVKKYDINILNLIDYSTNYSEAELRALPAGTYGVDSIQDLYDSLYATGQRSKIDALQAGCMVEVTDVNDLNEFIDIAKEVNAVDLISVYEKLRAGSYNHYWAFNEALINEGIFAGCASLGAEFAKTPEEYPSTHSDSSLTDDQKYSLAYMWNEERLAKDIYLALNELYPTKQLENIATKSESKHISAVEKLVEKYDINILNLIDYTVNYSEAELRALPAGMYGVDSVQILYDTLYAKGEQSKIDTLQVACMVEVTDVNDLDSFISVAEKVNANDLIKVYKNLRAGSYNHYWAFDNALKKEGIANGCASLGAEYTKTEAEYPKSQGNGESNSSNERGNKGRGKGRE